MSYPLVPRRPAGTVRALDLESFARTAGVHPELVRRLVALGLLDPLPGAGGEPRFAPTQLARMAQIQRLRTGLGINYAGLGLVLDLLDQVARMDAALRQLRRTQGLVRRIGD